VKKDSGNFSTNRIEGEVTHSNKKKYVKPSVRAEKIFETAALACGKCTAGNPISGGACFAVPRLS